MEQLLSETGTNKLAQRSCWAIVTDISDYYARTTKQNCRSPISI